MNIDLIYLGTPITAVFTPAREDDEDLEMAFEKDGVKYWWTGLIIGGVTLSYAWCQSLEDAESSLSIAVTDAFTKAVE